MFIERFFITAFIGDGSTRFDRTCSHEAATGA